MLQDNATDDVTAMAGDTPALDTSTLGGARRNFIGQASFAAMAAFGVGALAATDAFGQAVQTAPALTDADILNFALNLEYLEAEFYLRGAFGKTLAPENTTGTGTRGAVTGGGKVPFKTAIFRQYAEEIANDELAHVKFLRAALGRAAVARPKINLLQSFTNAARAAGVIGKTEMFNPFKDENSFLIGSYIFEDVGVTAYKGAARFIQNKDYLEAAAGILAVEAYHAGEIRTLMLARGLAVPAQKISDLRDAAGGSEADQGITDKNGRANVVPTDANGLAFSRSPQQVLNIVYLGGASGAFGFFPDKLNGNIK